MATVAETHELRKKCLRKALRLNPGNQTALKGLESLKRRPQHTPLDRTLTLPKTQPSYGILKGIAYAAGALAITVLILGIALLMLRDQLFGDGSWREFTPEGGRFSILVPRTPRETTETIETETGTLDEHTFTVIHGDIAYIAIYGDYPQSLTNVDLYAMLDALRDGAVESVDGRLLSERAISINGYPGREVKVKISSSSETAIMQVRIYIVRNRLYYIYTMAPEERASSPSIKKFLSSFKLLR
jgi:hypothetical protein